MNDCHVYDYTKELLPEYYNDNVYYHSVGVKTNLENHDLIKFSIGLKSKLLNRNGIQI